MPIRNRITGEAERVTRKRKETALHPLLKFGSRHHAIWQNVVAAKGKGMTAGNMQAQDPQNFHPQVLADLQKAKLVGKLAKNGTEFVYAADPAGKGVIAQEITAVVMFYETDKGKFVSEVKIVGQSPSPGNKRFLLGTKRVKFTVPEYDSPDIIDVSALSDNVIEPDDFDGQIVEGNVHKVKAVHIDSKPFPSDENFAIIEG